MRKLVNLSMMSHSRKFALRSIDPVSQAPAIWSVRMVYSFLEPELLGSSVPNFIAGSGITTEAEVHIWVIKR